ncbi:MAG: glucose-6-phosphate dehydrogenase [Thermotogota bacterium]
MKETKKTLNNVETCEDIKGDPASIVIFGGSGDLTFTKLIPSLFNLYKRNLLSENTYILGVGRTELNTKSYRQHIKESLDDKYKQIDNFLDKIYYLNGDYSEFDLYKKLKNKINDLDKKHQTNYNRLFYFATPQIVYMDIIKKLGNSNLLNKTEDVFPKVIVEKPFGSDYKSSKQLDKELHKYLEEEQIFRIDHYLGKETVQNILMFRFANTIFEPIWNYKYIDHIQINASEDQGIGSRAGYFENSGLLRDMFQNHMLQLLALVGMEAPAQIDAESVRDEKFKLLKSVRPLKKEDINKKIIKAQYTEGNIDGEKVKGYKQEDKVNSSSQRETYVAAKMFIDNWRWSGVPFYLRSGKRLKTKNSQITIHFKEVPYSIFSKNKIKPNKNILTLNIQPNEGFSLNLQAKQPGSKLCLNDLNMDFRYSEFFDFDPPGAYERLFLDVILNDQTLFVRSDAMETSWLIIDDILEEWDKNEKYLNFYNAGTWGPDIAEGLFNDDKWVNPEE